MPVMSPSRRSVVGIQRKKAELSQVLSSEVDGSQAIGMLDRDCGDGAVYVADKAVEVDVPVAWACTISVDVAVGVAAAGDLKVCQ